MLYSNGRQYPRKIYICGVIICDKRNLVPELQDRLTISSEQNTGSRSLTFLSILKNSI